MNIIKKRIKLRISIKVIKKTKREYYTAIKLKILIKASIIKIFVLKITHSKLSKILLALIKGIIAMMNKLKQIFK